MIAGNWKMNKTIPQAVEFTKELVGVTTGTKAEVVLCPAFTTLPAVVEAARGTNIAVGAQNLHWEESGAFTGEISAVMLKDTGCRYVLVGHSERRQYFGEIDQTVNKKVKAALKYELLPIICVGETLQQREAGSTEQLVGNQIKAALEGLDAETVSKLIVAYEPVWAIGTGKTASDTDAQKVIAYIRSVIQTQVGVYAEAVRILYGGSVKPANITGLMSQPDIDGALVGGASLEAASFAGIIQGV